jgi:hypothetical protein
MKDIKEIRFVTTNYYNLQGLRMIPLGLLLIYVGFWANSIKYPVALTDLGILILVMALMILIAFAIDRYYKNKFGAVKRTPESMKLETQVSTAGAFLALVAFWLDVSFKLPLSLIGIVAGLGLLADYLRITWLVKGRFLIYYPIGAIVIMLISLLPSFGLPGWWHAIGVHAQMFVIVFALGLFTVIAGVWGHIFLVRTLSTKKEEK